MKFTTQRLLFLMCLWIMTSSTVWSQQKEECIGGSGYSPEVLSEKMKRLYLGAIHKLEQFESDNDSAYQEYLKIAPYLDSISLPVLFHDGKFQEAFELFCATKYKSAIPLLKSCEAFYSANGYEEKQGFSLYLLSYCLRKKRQYVEAIEKSNKGADLFKAIGYEEGFALCFFQLGISNANIDTAMHYLEIATNVFEKYNLTKLYLYAENSIGFRLKKKGLFKASVKKLSHISNLAKELDDPKLYYMINVNLANSYQSLGNYAKALTTHNALLKESVDLDSALIRTTYGSIGNLYSEIRDYKKARLYYNKSLKINKSAYFRALQLHSIGLTYWKEDNKAMALANYKASLEISSEIKSNYIQAVNNIQIGKIRLNEGQSEEANKLFEEALISMNTMGNKGSYLVELYYNYGKSFIAKKQYHQAIKQCKMGVAQVELQENLTGLDDCHLCLSEAYELLGQNQMALFHLRQHLTSKDSFNRSNKLIDVARIEVNNLLLRDSLTIQDLKIDDIENKQLLHKEKAKTNIILGWLIFTCSLLAGIFFYIRSRAKYNKNLQLLVSKLNKSNSSLAFSNKKLNQSNEELDNANSKLKLVNQSLENFSSMAAHDLKAPLRTISAFNKILYKRHSEKIPEKDHEFFTIIQKDTKSLSDLIDDLLAFSHVDKNIRKEQSLNISEIIEDTIGKLDNAITRKKAKITYGDFPCALGHKSLIFQILLNTLNNSLKFSKDNIIPTIEIGYTAVKEGTFTIWIKDNGIGIKKESIPYIFDPFRRTHDRQKYAGSGIGLASCKKAVEHYGGRIWAESEVGVGTTIFFTVKCANYISPKPGRPVAAGMVLN